MLPGETVAVVDHVQVSGGLPAGHVRAASTISYTVAADWTDLLGLLDYQVDTGSVTMGATGLTWQLTSGVVDTWYTLTRTYSIAGSWSERHTMTDAMAVEGRAEAATMQIALQARYRVYVPVTFMENQAR